MNVNFRENDTQRLLVLLNLVQFMCAVSPALVTQDTDKVVQKSILLAAVGSSIRAVTICPGAQVKAAIRS